MLSFRGPRLWGMLALGLILNSQCLAVESFEKFWSLVTYTNRQHPIYYMIEPQLRLVNHSGGYEQFLLNAGVGYPFISELELWVGQTYTNIASSNAIVEDTALLNTNEYRLWEQLLWTHPEDHYVFELRSRLEERFSFEYAPCAIRWRNRLMTTIPIYGPYSFVVSDEFFFNLRSVSWVTTQTFDQNRAFVGISKQITPDVRINLGYMNQYLTRIPAEDDHIVFLNIFIRG